MQEHLSHKEREQIRVFHTLNDEQKEFVNNVVNGTIFTIATSLKSFLTADKGMLMAMFDTDDDKIVNKVNEVVSELNELLLEEDDEEEESNNSSIIDKLLKDVDLF